MGMYFLFVRPPLLPEDLRYMQTTLDGVQEKLPRLADWLPKVFWVMGSYIFTAGLLVTFIALTSFRTRTPGTFSVVAIAGITSIGAMSMINFIIGSDFKWVLLSLTFPWVITLILYRLHK